MSSKAKEVYPGFIEGNPARGAVYQSVARYTAMNRALLWFMAMNQRILYTAYQYYLLCLCSAKLEKWEIIHWLYC